LQSPLNGNIFPNMNTKKPDALTSNFKVLLTALAEVALEEELSFSEFSELSRYAFVKAAEKMLAGNKRVSDSRISIVTGLHRKDVKRLREGNGEEFSAEKAKGNRATSVISAWTREKDFLDENGNPIPLAYDNEAPSLTTLIKEYSGDMPVRAVCDELERMEVIKEKDDRWYLEVPVYVPSKSRESMFSFLGDETSHLVKTIHHNLNNPPRKRRFQRSVAYDELSPESVELFQALASERSMDLLKEFDSWLAKREKLDKQARKKNPGIEHKKAGLGIYYFEESPVTEPDGDKQ